MSVKAMSLVWDFPCPQTINDMEFKPNHKYVLQAYADHADHQGKSIYPAIETIANKTGYDPRTIQRITSDLEKMGLLVDDGMGPRGTNRWKLPFDEKARQIVTPTNIQGDKSENSLGDIPSGDIPSDDKMSYEFKEPEPNQFNISITQLNIWGDAKKKLQDEMLRAEFDTWVRHSYPVHFENNVLWIATQNDYSKNWMAKRLTARAQEVTGMYVRFMTIQDHRLEVQEPA